MALASDLVDVGQLAASGSAGDVVFVVADLDTAPGILVVGVRARDYEVCSEACSREAGCPLDLWHFALHIANAGEVDKVERIL